jgi:probable rRNA maturation factor
MRPTQSIHFYFDNVGVTLKDRKKLKNFVTRIVAMEKRNLSALNYVFCNDKTLLEINRKYLDHNFYTDVLTFDLSFSPKEILADIYISLDRVRENAKDLKIPLKEELPRVMFHGLLHLCGYNDKTKVQKKVMREKENLYVDLYFERFT